MTRRNKSQNCRGAPHKTVVHLLGKPKRRSCDHRRGRAGSRVSDQPGLEVAVRHLPPGGAVFPMHLISGEALGAAASAAMSGTVEKARERYDANATRQRVSN